MKVFLDTSVLVAAFVSAHPYHSESLAMMRLIRDGSMTAFISGHSLAEVYAVLTRTPFKPAIHPLEAWKIISVNVLSMVQVIPLTTAMCRAAIESCADHGWIGGRIYDVLQLACARQSDCDRVYTFNVRHFQQIAPDLTARIGAPSTLL